MPRLLSQPRRPCHCRGDYLIQSSCSPAAATRKTGDCLLKAPGMCHNDNLLQERWPLVGCVQEAKVFCCFNSKLARIVQEQGRPQLSTFAHAWSFVIHPANCRGFTTFGVSNLDFSKMDLSEYLGDIKTKAQSTIQETVTIRFNSTYRNTRP
jgi:conjugal transfer mating pair stabilization protein TraN